MARNYTTSTTSLWRPESKFTRLTGRQQAVYQMLKGQEHITAAGVLPLTVRRWAQTAADYTAETITDDLAALATEGHIVVDEDTEELLLVKFVRWDGGWKSHTRRPVIRDAALRVMSREIRAALADELTDFDALSDVVATLRDALSDTPCDTPPEGGDGSHRVVVTEGESGETTHNPQPATLLPARTARPAPKRGTRLTPDWRPSDEDRRWTLERLDQATAAVELEKFRNHWIAKTGKDATKLDWARTWRNWVLNARSPNGRASPSRQQQETDDLFDRAARRMGVAQ